MITIPIWLVILYLAGLWAAYKMGKWTSRYEAEKYRDHAIKLAGQLDRADKALQDQTAKIWRIKKVLWEAYDRLAKHGEKVSLESLKDF